MSFRHLSVPAAFPIATLIMLSASWLNLVERFFSELTERRLRRLAVTSVN